MSFLAVLESLKCELQYRLVKGHLREIPQLCNWLRRTLRRSPQWWEGHLLLAEASLDLRDFESAYASSLAARNARARRSTRTHAAWLLGRIYLQRGEFERALQQLEECKKHDRTLGARLEEDIAACYLALGEFAKAREILSTVPKEQLTPSGVSALLHLERK